MNSDDYQLVDFTDTIWKWRKTIILVTFLAGAGSILLSLTLKDHFKAKTIFYIASLDQAQPNKIFGDENIQYYGSSEDIDRAITIAYSNPLIDHIVDSFNLYEHYEINPDDPKAAYKVQKAFLKHYKVIKTKYNALELTFEDKDKYFATKLANSARERVDQLSKEIIIKRLTGQIKIINQSITENSQIETLLGDSLITLRGKFGIFNTVVQSEVFTTLVAEAESNYKRASAQLKALKQNKNVSQDTIAYLEAEVAGYQSQFNSLTNNRGTSKTNLNTFNLGKAKVEALEIQLANVIKKIGEAKIKLGECQSTLQNLSSSIHLIDNAEIPVYKSKPKRSIIVLSSTLLALIFTVMVILLFEYFQKVRRHD